MAILCRIPERFEHLIVAIDTTIGYHNLTLELMKSRLLQKEQRMSDRASEKSGSGTAMLGIQRRWKSIICHYCKKKGHIQINCFKKQREEADKDQAASAHLSVHHAGDEDSAGESESDFVCLIAAGAQKATNSARIVDSGATPHMTYDASVFESSERKMSAGVSIGYDSKL